MEPKKANKYWHSMGNAGDTGEAQSRVLCDLSFVTHGVTQARCQFVWGTKWNDVEELCKAIPS